MKRLMDYWLDVFKGSREKDYWWGRKRESWRSEAVELVRIQVKGHIFEKVSYDNKVNYYYTLYVSYLLKQDETFYKEEQVTDFQFRLIDGEITEHKRMLKQEEQMKERPKSSIIKSSRTTKAKRFSYDRRAAVQYAEYWWNSYNSEFQHFTVDCTNFVSQCLLAGGAPMRGMPVRDQGWWYKGENWSFSWAVAHSLRWYLSGLAEGLQAKEVFSASELLPGDVICYDFQGDGRWDHTTIVVVKDTNNEPLVNAHTDNSRHRYWSYEDSTAWTPNIKYKFFQIGV